jgi:hypothetical protein
MFACEAEGVEPDLMTVAKGLTSGYVPMGATDDVEKVYAGIADGRRRRTVGRPRRHLFGAPGERRRGLEVLRLYVRAACWPMAWRRRRASKRACAHCAIIRWWATRAPRPAGRPRAGEQQGQQGAASIRRWACRPHRRKAAYRNGWSSARSATTSSASRRR